MQTHLTVDTLAGEAALARIPELLPLAAAVFEDEDRFETLPADAAEKPGLMLLLARSGQELLGFKIGYRRREREFYSWLGGVHPSARGQGVARQLMDAQHDWAAAQGYEFVRTETFNKYRSMLILNIRSGFEVVGTLSEANGETRIILRKRLKEPGAVWEERSVGGRLGILAVMSDASQPISEDQSSTDDAPTREGLHEQTIARLNNQTALKEAGFATHPYSYAQTHHAADVLKAHPGGEPGTRWDDQTYSLAGRVMQFRHMGGAAFADVQDGSGTMQVYFGKKVTQEFAATKKIDLGDIIGVRGVPFVTKSGQVTLEAASWQPLVKSLHPLPSKFHGLQDDELRARRRYVDLMVNSESREVFRTRSRVVRFIRTFLDTREFMEVEGPTLQVVPGGTEARPFRTHHNALDHEFSLRISLELYLKRLLVGGFERVYEIGRNYRNEGIDRTHNPEFTMLEAYFAYGDYQDMMRLVETLLHDLVVELKGEPKLTYQGKELDFSLPFARLDFVTALREEASLDFDPLDLVKLREWSDVKHPEFRKVPDYKLLDKLGGEYVEPGLHNPTFLTDMPLVISPLVKAHREREGLAERADLYIAGFELAPIYSELNDALDQRARFEAQTARRDAGDDEAHQQDEDFLLALEYGMPPTAGMGMGIDRLTMLMADRDSIRDVLLFPLLRPEGE